MTTLTYESLVRVETDAEIIANLQRKGWVENEPPSYDAATQHAPTWDGVAWTVADNTAEEIAAEARQVWKPEEFRKRFTDAELLDFLDKSRTVPALDMLRFKLTTVQEVVSDNPDLLAAMDALVQAEVITVERRTEILTA